MNELLYGHDATENIVAIEVKGNVVYEYIQTADGVGCNEYHNYKPWMYKRTPNSNTDDNNYYNTIERLDGFGSYYYEKIQRKNGIKFGAGFRGGAYNTELPSVYMIDTGKTLFKGLDFDDVHQLALDIETTGLLVHQGAEFKMVSLADNRGYKKILFSHDERQLILDLIDEVRRLDPTIILTYNGSAFDFPFLEKRCALHGLELNLGRDGSGPIKYDVPLRLGVGSNDEKLPGVKFFGRHHIDLYYSVKKFDFTDRRLESYGLKNVISRYGLEKEGRLILSAPEIFEGLASPIDSEKYKAVHDYCLDDSVDLINLHPFVNQAEFYLTQIIPMNYDILCTKGNVARINYIILRGYLRNFASVPMWSEHIKYEELSVGLVIRPFNDTPQVSKDLHYTIEEYSKTEFTIKLVGGEQVFTYPMTYLELFKIHIQGAVVETDETGIFEYVGDSDIASMYPNMMIMNDIFPANDSLQIMKKSLTDLTTMRITIKHEMQVEKDPMIKARKKGQQLAMKAVINCFHPDTTVLTNDGYKNIEDIEIGEIVQSINPKTLKSEWKPVIAKEKKQKGGRMLEFKTNSGKIFRVTEGHNLATFDMNVYTKADISKTQLIKKEAKDFNVGDAVPIPNKEIDSTFKGETEIFSLLHYMDNDIYVRFILDKGYHGRTFLKDMSQFKFIDKLTLDSNSRSYKIRTKDLTIQDKNDILSCVLFSKTQFKVDLKPHKSKSCNIWFWMDDFMKFMGWFISEGSTYRSKRKAYTTTVRGESHMIQVAQYSNINPKNSEDIRKLLTNMGFTLYYNEKQYSFCCEPLYILLKDIWGIGTAKEKSIPKDILILSNDNLRLLMDTYFKGDGNYLRHGNKRYSTSSPQLKQDITFILQRMGIHFSVGVDSAGCYRIIERMKYKSTSDVVVDYIKSITEIDMPSHVWDITVADNHTICVGDNGTVCTFQSYFGVLSSNGFFWKDSLKCMSVTAHGRDLIIKIRDHLIGMGYRITALDTDGVAYTKGEDFDIDEVNQSIQDMLPEGIDIESQKYKGMIVFKRKTYVVRDYEDVLTFKGAAITAKTTAPALRTFLRKVCMLMFDSRFDDVKLLYKTLIDDIRSVNYPIEMFASVKQANRTVEDYVMSKSLWQQDPKAWREKYHLKQFSTQPLYELAIKTQRTLVVGDKVQYFHAIESQPKPYTKTELKKQEIQNQTMTMFEVPIVRKMIDVGIISWVDEYKANLDQEHYIRQINTKIEALFLKKTVEKEGKKWKEGVLNESMYGYVFAELDQSIETFGYKDFTIKTDTGFTKWQRTPVRDVWKYMRQGLTDAFVSVQLFQSETQKEYEFAYCQLYFDLDSPDVQKSFEDAQLIYKYFKNVLRVDSKYITIWYSGSKGFHIEVNPKIFGISPRQNLQLINKEIALDLIDKYELTTVDIGSIYSKRRMWRLPFSVHGKTGIRKTRVVDFEAHEDVIECQAYVMDHQDVETELTAYKTYLQEMSDVKVNLVLQEWFNAFIKKYEVKQSHIVNKKSELMFKNLGGKLPKCIEYLLKNSISRNGDRNKATMILTAFFKEFGTSKEDCLEMLVDWTEAIPDGLTSTTSRGDIVGNIKTVINTIYNKENYNFQCYFIVPLIGSRGFSCNTGCKLAD